MIKNLSLLVCSIASAHSILILSPQPLLAMPVPTTVDFSKQPPIGELGQPLGQITTISGTVRQEALGAKASKLDLVLRVETVNDRPLPQPITIRFTIFPTAQISKPVLGQSFTYVGYETGGFTGVPTAAFKWVPAIATTGFEFETRYQILEEVLARVKTKADLLKWQDRRVQIIGRYLATPKGKPTTANANVINPITSDPVFQGSYTTVAIELADGTRVALYSPLLKQSNRPLQEVKAFAGKMVIVVGKIAQASVSTSRNSESKLAIVSMERIELEREQPTK